MQENFKRIIRMEISNIMTVQIEMKQYIGQ